MARERVWVLWAKTWKHREVQLCRVTSKNAYQKYVNNLNAKIKKFEEKGWQSVEDRPLHLQESTDKVALETMRNLAQPLAKGN